jgi:flagellar protein FlaG
MSNDVSPVGARPASLASSQAYKPPHIQETNGSKIPPNMNAAGAGFNGLATDKPQAAVGATDTSLEQQLLNASADKATADNKLAHASDQQERMENLREAMEKLNNQAAKTARSLNFTIDEKLNRQIITVSNKETGEVVRQIPTEVVLRVAHSIEDIKGLLLDEQI